jgi:hypothetical protein
MDPHDAILTLQHILDTATFTAVPYTKVRPKPPTTRHKKWTPELAEAIQKSKLRKHLWMTAGEPKEDHPAWLNKKAGSKQVRAVQRQQKAADRRQTNQDASNASVRNQPLLHRMIRAQRQVKDTTAALRVNRVLVTDDEGLLRAFARASEALALPKQLDHPMDWVLEHMRVLVSHTDDVIQVSSETITGIIRNMKSNKAADRDGYRAEHLKLLLNSPLAIQVITAIFNNIFSNRFAPESIKSAYKIPIPKKG